MKREQISNIVGIALGMLLLVIFVIPVAAMDSVSIDVQDWEVALQQLICLVVYMIILNVVFGIREYKQKKTGVFASVDVLPLEEQLKRIFGLIIGIIPWFVWLLWYSEVMISSSYLWICLILEMTPQSQGPNLIRWIIIMIFCIDVVRTILGVKQSHLKSRKLVESVMGPVRERIITERVLVVCPFCGKKNEQGIGKCQNCGADL